MIFKSFGGHITPEEKDKSRLTDEAGFWGRFSLHMELLCASKWRSMNQKIFSFVLCGDGQIMEEGHCTNISYTNIKKKQTGQNYSEIK